MPIPNPVAFTIFHIDIMWYGILITAGIALATIVCMRRAPKHGLDGDRILNFVIISVPVAIVGARLYYVIWKIRPLDILDLAAPCIALAQAIGRWGNYFNSEAHGGPTDLPWAVTVNGQTYHPTFLYESIWCFLLFLFLLYMDNRRTFEGQTICLYGMLYSVERFFVEALRTDSLMVGPFKQAQVISFVIFVVCLAGYFILRNRGRKIDRTA